MAPDNDLLRRYADHRDEAAFAELVRRHVNLVHATARRVLHGDTHRAQDVTQTVFTSLARDSAAVRDHATVAGWLHTTARYVASNTVRTEQRRQAREQEAVTMSDANADADVAWEQLRPLLDVAVGQLGEADRDAVLLRYFEGMSHREVGAILNLDENTARMRVERALEKLRGYFSQRGVTTTAVLLAATLSVNAAPAAPAAFASTLAAQALAGAAAVGTGVATATGAGAGLRALSAWKVRLVMLTAAGVAGLAVFLLWPAKTISPAIAPTPPPPMKTPIAALAVAALLPAAAQASDYESAATSTNQLGLELFQQVAAANPGGNVLLSPFSIQNAFAMTYAGAEGDTRAELARVLHYPADDAPLATDFGALRTALDATAQKSVTLSARLAQPTPGNGGRGRTVDTIEWHIANRLFGQTSYEFREPFLAVARDRYGAPLELMDFRTAAEPARVKINTWVADQTHQKIPDLIPPKGVDGSTRLVLVNALYLKAPWQNSFESHYTTPRLFQVRGTTPVSVPTMRLITNLGMVKRDGYTAVILPYVTGELQFLILLPDDPAGVDALAAQVTPGLLHDCAQLSPSRMALYLPKFRVAGPTLSLKPMLLALGMKTVFTPAANFNRMTPPQPDGPLHITDVFHKTFLALDEDGTEAAAATAVIMGRSGAPPGPVVEVNADHPFLFAIQLRESGACLFLGKVTDPR